MQNHALCVANFLVDQEFFHVGSLVSTQLDDLSHFHILLHGAVATEILLEGLANALDIQVVGQTCHGCDTLSTVSLLDTDVHFFFRRDAALVSGILKGVCFGSLALESIEVSARPIIIFLWLERSTLLWLLTECIEL